MYCIYQWYMYMCTDDEQLLFFCSCYSKFQRAICCVVLLYIVCCSVGLCFGLICLLYTIYMNVFAVKCYNTELHHSVNAAVHILNHWIKDMPTIYVHIHLIYLYAYKYTCACVVAQKKSTFHIVQKKHSHIRMDSNKAKKKKLELTYINSFIPCNVIFLQWKQ